MGALCCWGLCKHGQGGRICRSVTTVDGSELMVVLNACRLNTRGWSLEDSTSSRKTLADSDCRVYVHESNIRARRKFSLILN